MSNGKFEVVKKVIPINKDRKFGLGVSDNKNKVIVSTIEEDSVAVQYLKINDCITSINGVKVKDKSHCRDLIVNAPEDENDFEFIIERPIEKSIEKSAMDKMIERPVEKVTEKPMEKEIEKPVEKVTERQEPKEKPTEKATEKPTEKVTEKQVEKVTEQPKQSENLNEQSKSKVGEKKSEIIEIAELGFQPVKPPKDEPKKEVQMEKVTVNTGGFMSFLDADEFHFGNPLEGLTFPAPADVRAILRKRISEIIADYEKGESSPSLRETIKQRSGSEIQFEAETHEHAIGSDVPSTKSLSKVKPNKKK